jgi:hypothetical protein
MYLKLQCKFQAYTLSTNACSFAIAAFAVFNNVNPLFSNAHMFSGNVFTFVVNAALLLNNVNLFTVNGLALLNKIPAFPNNA